MTVDVRGWLHRGLTRKIGRPRRATTPTRQHGKRDDRGLEKRHPQVEIKDSRAGTGVRVLVWI